MHGDNITGLNGHSINIYWLFNIYHAHFKIKQISIIRTKMLDVLLISSVYFANLYNVC